MRLGFRRALLLFVASIGCKDKAGAAGATSAQASASASASLVKPVSLPPACRAIQVKGDVQSAAGPIALLMPLDGRTWVTLGEGAELALRHGISAREFEVRGPGRFLPCRGGLEQVLVSDGRVKSSSGTGVRPGGEFLIASPFGSVAYGDADLDVTVRASSLELELRRGELVTELAPGTSGYPKDGLKGTGRAKVEGTADPAKLLDGCEVAAKEAAESAGRVLSAAGKQDMAKEAASQLVVRRRARAVCAIAAAGLEREPDPSKKSALEQRLAAAERAWRTVPSR
jgi:hypothetical protein